MSFPFLSNWKFEKEEKGPADATARILGRSGVMVNWRRNGLGGGKSIQCGEVVFGRGRRRQVKDFKQAVKPETASRDTGVVEGGGQIINWGG